METTPSTERPAFDSHMARASSAVRGKSGVKFTFCAKSPIFSWKRASSSSVSGSGGFSSMPMSAALPCAPSAILPSSAVIVANAPGMPPVARTSALFWKSTR